MLRIDIIATIPELLDGPFSSSILKRAVEKNLVDIVVHDLKEYGLGKHKQIDDYQYGGGAGMVLMVEPIQRLLAHLEKDRKYDAVIFMTPDGEKLTQNTCNELALHQNILILCGHYKGIDQRIRDYLITREISIGDYVLTGGELPAAIVVDTIVRLLPGVLNNETSALTDSFQDGLLAPPVYTRPAEINGWKVPDVLLSGHDQNIANWRHEESLKKTQLRRPDLLEE